MRSHDEDRIAYLSAVALLFSYAELFLPRVVPFLRLGISNAALLWGLSLPFRPFLLLCLTKSLASCLVSGTLFSPFLIVSVLQTFASGILMFIMDKIPKKLLSVYGISMLGAVASAVVQILLCSAYLGRGVFSLLGAMVLFSLFSGIVTAGISRFFSVPDPKPISVSPQTRRSRAKPIFQASAVVSCAVLVFLIDDLRILLILSFITVIFQAISGRRLMVAPYLGIWIFVLATAFFTPNGRILFSLGAVRLTLGALLLCVKKALCLTACAALSQTATAIRADFSSLLGKTFAYFSGISAAFKAGGGNAVSRLRYALDTQNFSPSERASREVSAALFAILLFCFIAGFLIDWSL